LSGELYKNSFVNQDFPLLNFGRPNKNKFYYLKMNPANLSKHYFTNIIIKHGAQMKKKIIHRFFDDNNDRKRIKSKVYFEAGAKILRYRMVVLTNARSFNYDIFAPLSEPSLYKLCYDKNPINLELGRFQRSEVSKFCPQIKDIRTNRGATLSNNYWKMLKEAFLSYKFLVKIGVKRIFFRGNEASEIQLDSFTKGRNCEEFVLAMNKCKALGVLKKDCDIKDLTAIMADRLMTIGLDFMKYKNKEKLL